MTRISVFAALALLLAVGCACSKAELVPMPGAPQDANANEADVQTAVDFAVKELNHAADAQGPFELVRIVSMQRQVVAGLNYIMTLELARDGKHEIHHATVYNRFGDMSLTRHEVEPASDRRVLLGDLEGVGLDDEGVQRALQFAMAELNRRSNGLSTLQLAEVTNVRKQVVAGMKYYFDLVVLRGAAREVHHVEVWDHFGDLSVVAHEVN